MIDETKMFSFTGKVVVITGGRRGIGLALAKEFVQRKAKVVIVGQSEKFGQEENFFKKYQYEYLSANLVQREERNRLIDRVFEEYKKVDVLINCAGVQKPCSIDEYPLQQWDDEISLMLTTPFELSKRVACKMKELKIEGKIITYASISSFQGARNIVGYSVAKHGIVGLTKCLANEFAPFGINVNAIAPGITETDMAENVLKNEEHSKILKGRIPDGRFATVDDMVGPTLFLASDLSKHIHGHVLVVDGGWLGR